MHDYMTVLKSKDDEKMIYTCEPQYGTGDLTVYFPAKGIAVNYLEFLMKGAYDTSVCCNFDCSNHLCINYCVTGKYETEFSDQTVIYLTDGDFSVWSGRGEVVACDSSYKKYKGISIVVDIDKSASTVHQLIQNRTIDLRTHLHSTLNGKTAIIAKPGAKVLHIFNEMYDLPSKYVPEYLRIKVAELLLLIYTGDFEYDDSEVRHYPRSVVQSAKGAKAYIEEHFSEHITIAELARRTAINSKKLMECFKFIYGMTINECLQRTRMTKAIELLVNTDFMVGDISALVGYESASKFAEMFQRHTGILPAQYRKEHHLRK